MSVIAEILLAEDDETDVLLLRRAFQETGITHVLKVARDGQEAIEELAQREYREEDRLPALAILDLKMPRRNGLETLQWIRKQPGLRCLPVFIFSSSAHREDVERSYSLGANGFLVKPASTSERTEVARFILEWLRLNQPPCAVTDGFKAAQAFHAARGIGSSTSPFQAG